MVLLFLVAFVAGNAAFYVTYTTGRLYQMALVAAGAYLFSITLLHIVPQIFYQSDTPIVLGLCVVLGFLFQKMLEYVSRGVEHGHIHTRSGENIRTSAWWILATLFLHAAIEGALLGISLPFEHHHHHLSKGVLWGILLHKAPEAFAFMTVLLSQKLGKLKVLFMLSVFSLASPLGWALSETFLSGQVSGRSFVFVAAVVAGIFLQISTTIVFESSNANHNINWRKMFAILIGCLFAIGFEFLG